MPSDYGLHKAPWLGWLRSGDRRFYDFAVARTRFINDLAICHEDTPTRWKGSFTAGIAPIPWGTMGGARAPLHMKVGAFEFERKARYPTFRGRRRTALDAWKGRDATTAVCFTGAVWTLGATGVVRHRCALD